jgi:nicotinate-nucleotide adenylyltransferase
MSNWSGVTDLRRLTTPSSARASRDGPRRIGLLGGTFDPPHMGHLVLAQEAWAQLDLDQVLLVPAGEPPHKAGREISPVDQRLAMVTLAVADNGSLGVSRADIDRPGPHFTVGMLEYIRHGEPDTLLYFIMGADSLADLLHWHQPRRIAELAKLVVMRRPGREPDIAALAAEVPGITGRVYYIDAPLLEISSTDVQSRVRQLLPVRYLVPDRVVEYIRAHGLYRKPVLP